jgi:hypothetical protein
MVYRELKIKPYERYIGEDNILSYIGIRADENRQGYVSRKPNIRAIYPFKEEGITKADVYRILESSGLGIPSYYRWRSRSGCFFCFFQQRIEWIGLLENHPDLFEEAKRYEKIDGEHCFTWSQGESLTDLERPERIMEIRAEHARRMEMERNNPRNQLLVDVFSSTLEAWQTEIGCTICEL